MAVPIPEGRAQYLPEAKTVSGGRFFSRPIFLWGMCCGWLITSSNFDLSVRLNKAPNL